MLEEFEEKHMYGAKTMSKFISTDHEDFDIRPHDKESSCFIGLAPVEMVRK